MNNHPILQRLDDRFYVMHAHSPFNHESSSGRNVAGWISDSDGQNWIGPFELFPPVSEVQDRKVTPQDRILFGCQFHQASDGMVYAMARVGYKSWERNLPNREADHFHTGFLARSISRHGKLGPIFWIEIKEDVSKHSLMAKFVLTNRQANWPKN